MGLLGRLLGHEKDQDKPDDINRTDDHAEEGEAVVDDPARFADWLNEYLVLSVSFEDDLSEAPDQEVRDDLQISEDEVKLYALENAVLRAAGVCWFVKKEFSEVYYLSFRDALVPPVEERIRRYGPHMHEDDVSAAIERYIDSTKSDSPTDFNFLYIDRVYPYTPSKDRLWAACVYQLGLGWMHQAFKSALDGYCRLKTGLDYDTYAKLVELSEV